ncbi:MAG: class I SAM-dependent methyltransferase [Opitutae bacterium]|nr:class I SAM-dependent methyltransferase [Opitutae bacterium]
MLPAALDLPTDRQLCDPLSLRVQGWVFAADRQRDITRVEVRAENRVVGQTALLYPRADVSAVLGLAADTCTGFAVLADAGDFIGRPSLRLEIVVVFADGRSESALSREIVLSTRDYRQGDWGKLLQRDFGFLVRREHMYNSGPSQAVGSAGTLELLQRYLPPAPARIVDVGCGLGYYGRHLRAAGYDWMGAEMKATDCAELARQGLPHRQVDGQRLPFADGEFDAAICIEVLEHTEHPAQFIADVRRVIRRRLLISVPNLEVVPYWRAHLAVPWHLLESDHRNFFSRASLRELLQPHFREIEVLGYGEAPLRTAEGAALDYHLFAIASL